MPPLALWRLATHCASAANVENGRVQCSECSREVDEFEAISQEWGYWNDGSDLLQYCRECAEREFGGEATEPVPLAHPRAASNGS
jgi:hypothetical protein